MLKNAILAMILISAAPAFVHADAILTRSGGQLGGSLTLDLDADSGESFVLFTSITTGPTPLSVFDPNDARSLSVGLELLNIAIFASVNGAGLGSISFSPLPTLASLQGVPIHHQFVTYPGANLVIDEVSNAVSYKLSLPGESTFTIGDLAEARYGHTSTELSDGRVLIAGGIGVDGLGSDVVLDTVELFDPQTQSFTSLTGPNATLSSPRTYHTATRLNDGRVLISGGVDGNDTALASCDIFNPATGIMTLAASMATPRFGHPAVLLNNGRVFASGGVSALDLANPLNMVNNVLASTETYNSNTNTWSSGPNFPTPRIGHKGTLLNNGQVLITGGVEITGLFVPTPGLTNDCQRYNPTNNTFVGTSNFAGARADHAQVLLDNGDVLVAGGVSGLDLIQMTSTSASTCRRYNPSNNSWTNVASMAFARNGARLVNTGGSVAIIGGASAATQAGSTLVTAIETSAQGSISWASPSAMLLPRGVSNSVAIEGGERILTVGRGDNGNPAVADKTAELFHP